jgi:uncharacterized protein (DUF952 family)
MTYIYHIAAAADWEQGCRDGEYRISTRDRSLAQVGFIHAGTAGQVAPVANAIYKGVPDLVVLVIDPDKVRPEVRYEEVSGWPEPFPHIYGPLNVEAVVQSIPFESDSSGHFSFEAG